MTNHVYGSSTEGQQQQQQQQQHHVWYYLVKPHLYGHFKGVWTWAILPVKLVFNEHKDGDTMGHKEISAERWVNAMGCNHQHGFKNWGARQTTMRIEWSYNEMNLDTSNYLSHPPRKRKLLRIVIRTSSFGLLAKLPKMVHIPIMAFNI